MLRTSDAVGIHKSSLFHHYAGKRELAAEVFLQALDRVLEILDPLADEAAGDAEAVFPVLDRLVDHFSDAPEEARLLMALIIAPEDTELHEVFGGREPAAVAELYARLARWLERARSSGRIRRVPIRQTLFNLIAVALFYPAAIGSQQLVDAPLLGSDPFSDRARQIRKHELRVLVQGVLVRPDCPRSRRASPPARRGRAPPVLRPPSRTEVPGGADA